MFSDDTNLFISGIDVDDYFDMSCELNKRALWFKAR